MHLTDVTGGKPDVVGKKFSMSAKQKQQATSEVDKLGSKHSNKSWRKGGANDAIKELKKPRKFLEGQGYFDSLIASKYKVSPVPAEFVNKVYSELTSHIKRFKPDINDSFHAWVNSQVANKAGTVYNREYKYTQQTEDSEDKTAAGAPRVEGAEET